jgi:LysM repeat protein
VSQARNSGSSPRRRVALDGSAIGSRQSTRGLRSILSGRRKKLALSGLVPVVLVAAIASGMASASACHPLIQAGANCDGTVAYTATAWNNDSATDETRTNTNVRIQYSTSGVDGPYIDVPSERGQFNKANDFSFSGSFELPDDLQRPTQITVQAIAAAKWGSKAVLDEANQFSRTTIRVPANCEVPSVKIQAPACESKQARVTLTNNAAETVEFRFYKDEASAPFETHKVVKGSVTKDIAVNEGFDLSVQADDMKTVRQTLSVPVDCVKVAGQVAKVCKADATGWTVTYDNSQNTSARSFVLKSGERTIDTVAVEAGKSETKSYDFSANDVAAGTTLPISVVADDVVITTQTITNDCVNVAADAVAACDTPAGSGALLTFTNTGQVAETFTVVRDGKAVEGSPFTLQPSNQTTQKLLKLDEGDTAVISIISSSGLNIQRQVTVNCEDDAAEPVTPTEVKGEVINRGQLADTGFTVAPVAGVGAGLLLIGSGVLYLRRRVS